MSKRQEAKLIASIGAMLPSQQDERAQATMAGQGLGAYDKEANVFDDTPPSGISGELVPLYQAAYQKANPAYAIG